MNPASIRLRSCALAALVLTLAAVPAAAQSPTLLRLRNATSADRLVLDSAGGLLVRGNGNRGAIPATGIGTRLMWYPRKAAFRAGHVTGTEWNDGNVGFYSVALGVNPKASGFASTALGHTTTASGNYSTALGYESTASGEYAVAMGYQPVASAEPSVAIGNRVTASGSNSTAMGRFASTNGHSGAFVYGDASTSTELTATAAHQFSVRAAGGYRFFTSSGMTVGAQLQAGQSTWSALSDRSRKSRFLAVDGEDVLSRVRTLPVSTWIYTDQPDPGVRHIGPMAQDWARAFGFSSDSLTINSGDFDGVNLAAVQALLARTDALRGENAALRERIRSLEAARDAARGENSGLRARLERLEALVTGGGDRR